VYSRTGIKKGQFVIAIPFKDVQIANLFDEKIYAENFAPAAGKAEAKITTRSTES
jgi:hypothetical protein